MIRPLLISSAALILFPCLSGVSAMAQNSGLRVGGSADRIEAADGYTADVFARRLGQPSAIVRHADGTLYVADRDGGRIFRVQDRRMDGTADITQALPHRFDTPSGLALRGDTLFVADRGGVWRLQPGGGTPQLLAPFAKSGSRGDRHPIARVSPTSLRLGLSKTDGTAQLLDIDINTGRAVLRETVRGEIVGFSSFELTDDEDAPSPPFVLWQRDGEVFFGATLAAAQPVDGAASAIWLDTAQGRARLSLPDGVFETQATFAGISDRGTALLSGFGRQATPGAMVSDARGLFVIDGDGGRLWRLRTADPVTDVEDAISARDYADPRPAKPELMRGSGIGRASRMPNGKPPQTKPDEDQSSSSSDE